MSAQYPEVTNESPAGNALLNFGTGAVTFTWTFVPRTAAPSETQSSFLISFHCADGTPIILPAGSLGAGSQNGFDSRYWGYDGTAHTVTLTFPSNIKGKLIQWFAEVHGTASPDSNAGDGINAYFTMDDTVITFSITTPAGSTPTVGTPSPLIGWTLASGSGAQMFRQVVFKLAGTSTVVHDSGELQTSQATYQPPAVLQNLTSYDVTVTLRNANGSASVTKTISTNWSPPADPSFSASFIASDNYVDLNWTNASKDFTWTAWRVYRKDTSTSNPVLLAEFTTDQANYEYKDYSAPVGTPQYAIVQVADRSGFSVQSNGVYTPVTVTSATKYALICPANPTLNVVFDNVTEDDPTESFETQTIHVIGAGRKTDYGDRLGWTGSIVAQVYDRDSGLSARQVRLNLQAMKALKTELFLRNPFGDLWSVNAGDMAIKRISGVGQREFFTVTIPYEELASET